ncbi:MAG: type II and III secretion system protein family protein [Blastocatellia bacterium]|nr:type II and III secretion system protein family protein [Blastocatellia bacterium]
MKQTAFNRSLFGVSRGVARSAAWGSIAILSLFITLPAGAQEFYVQAAFAGAQREAITINAMVGQSRVIRFNREIGRISVSNSEVAEAVVVASDQVVVNGKSFGQVNFIAWDRSGEQSLVFDIYVRANLALVDALMRSLFPKDDILLSQANGSVILSGTVDDPRKVGLVEAAVQAAGFKTVNMLRGPFRNATQVQLQVRVAEVNRNRMREFGTSYSYQTSPGTGGYMNSGSGPSSVGKIENGAIFGTVSSALNLFLMGDNAMGFIRLLHSQGALRGLAEPNLIAMDGQQASFLAGGEFPVPIVQSGTERSTVTIAFKEYGVRLSFKPAVVGEDYIRLELEPEVSTIDYANGVKFDGFTIPALRTRRAKTGIELRDGQSFALAGLLDNSEMKTLSKIPLLGDVPVLGALFRSQQFQKQETELMFIVTATLVRPVNPDSLPKMRGVEDLKSGSPLAKTEKGEELTGRTGFAPLQPARLEAPAAPAIPAVMISPGPMPLARQAAAVSRPAWASARFLLMLPAGIGTNAAVRPRLAEIGVHPEPEAREK